VKFTLEKVGTSEVAYLLGYSEPSVFHRAFRRWFDTTPNELRTYPVKKTSNALHSIKV